MQGTGKDRPLRAVSSRSSATMQRRTAPRVRAVPPHPQSPRVLPSPELYPVPLPGEPFLVFDASPPADPGGPRVQLERDRKFFFSRRRRHTRYIGDWSSDVCSSDLQVSSDGKRVTVNIRHGVHYSPPVNREVTAADVAYGIERGANPNVANPYFPSYFSYLVGGDKADGGPIAGITTPSKYTIVFHLTGRDATFFTGALSMPITSPVPKEFAVPLDKKKPTQYGDAYEVATGPYMLKSDSKGKFLGIGYQPGKSATLVRNPNWQASTDFRPAYLDQVNINIGGDTNVIGRQVLTGSHMVQNDKPAGPIVKLAYQHYFNQLFAVPGTGDFYLALNNKSGPFRNENLRKAVWAALDRSAMIKVAGGSV